MTDAKSYDRAQHADHSLRDGRAHNIGGSGARLLHVAAGLCEAIVVDEQPLAAAGAGSVNQQAAVPVT